MANILITRSGADEAMIMRMITKLAGYPQLGERSVALRPIYRRYVCGDFQIIYRPPYPGRHLSGDLVVVAIRPRGEEPDETL
jgi:hypothetical protein